jgi:hypothetical protein
MTYNMFTFTHSNKAGAIPRGSSMGCATPGLITLSKKELVSFALMFYVHGICITLIIMRFLNA